MLTRTVGGGLGVPTTATIGPVADNGVSVERELRIGLIAPPWVPVPPSVYGGTEQVIDVLARGLTEAGHEVTLFASGDSTCPVARRWLYPKALGTTTSLFAEMGQVQAAYDEFADLDVIHDHTLLGPLWALAEGAVPPIVTTSHGPFTPVLRRHFETIADRVAVVAISHHQLSTAPGLRGATVIHHGIDVERIPEGAGDGGYVLFLGRMSPDKGPDRAILAARAAGRRILVAAKMWEPEEQRYFREHVEPLLGPDATYVGEPTVAEKFALLAGAAALVNPIRWAEPFGLVMIEALASGTPVLAFAEGSAPEIVEDGVTGFVCRDHDELVERLGRVDEIDRARCRAAAVSRFSRQRMVNDHVLLYRSLLAAPRDLAGRSGPLPALGWSQLS